MRYLILSDIHANATALEAALEAAKGRWDKVLCLGDVVGYGPDPNEVIDKVRELGATTIRGNHDKAGSGIANADDFNPVARNVALWTRDQLRPENRVMAGGVADRSRNSGRILAGSRRASRRR